jgi:DNA primase
MESVDPERKQRIALKEELFRLNFRVMGHYGQILNNSPGAQGARNYLGDRGITPETIDTFCLGYAEDRWDDMVRFFRQLKLGRNLAEQSGLVLERKSDRGGKKGYYDRFRNRIVFPIVDTNMQVAGFGGRVMDDSMPKYLNSPETPVYSKGRILYGLHLAKQYCRQEDCVYIVEGYFDFLSLFQNGIKNTVASLGTALTVDHVRRLKGFATRAILVFDSDNAGINAAKRSVSTFAAEGVDVRILVLPKGHDPDSFVNAEGADVFKRSADQAMSVMDFLTDTAMKKHGSSVEGRIAVLEEMKQPLARIEDSAARSLYVRELAEQLGIDESAVLERVRNAVSTPGARQPVNLPGSGNLSDPGDSGETLESYRREEQMLAMMIQHAGVRREAVNQGVLDHFYSERFRRIGTIVAKWDANKEMMAADLMAAMADDSDRQLVASLAMMDGGLDDDVLEKSVFLMKRIVKVRVKTENTLANQIRRAEQGGDSQLPFELLKKRQREIRKLHGYE